MKSKQKIERIKGQIHGIGKLGSYIHKLISTLKGAEREEGETQFNILGIRLFILAFVIVNFHFLYKYPPFKLALVNIIELSYLVGILVFFIFSKRLKFLDSHISKLIFDFSFISTFEYLSLTQDGMHSWLYILFFIPVIYCSFWFNWVFTFIFVSVVSVTYSLLNYYLLNLEMEFPNFFERIRILAPIVIIFYLVAFGAIYYKRKLRKGYQVIARRVKQKADELKQEKEFTRNLLKSSLDAIIAVDENGNISEVNERTCELFEYNKEEMETQPVEKFYDTGQGNRVMEKLRNSKDGTVENFNTFILSKSGEKIPILLSAAFLYDRQKLNLKTELSKDKKFSTVGYFRDMRVEKAIDDISKEITSILDEKRLFIKIAENVTNIIKAEACSILTYNEGKGLFKVIGSYGMPEILEKSQWLEEYDEKDSMIARIFSSKEPLNISNIDLNTKQPRDIEIKWNYAQNFAKYSRFGDFKHFLGTPLIVQGEVYGIIRVINKYCGEIELDKQGFTEKDIRLLERISNQVTILIGKVRDKGRFRAISEVGKKLNEMYDMPLSDLLETISREVVKGMRFKACYLRLVEKGDILKIKSCYGLKGEYTNNEKYNLKIGEGISGKITATGNMLVIEDVKNEKRFKIKGILEKEELSSMLSMPLKYRNRVIGVINCYTRRVHKFTEQEIQIMNTFAAYASTAIQNKKRVEELVYALNEIGNELVKPIKIEELFDLILKRAKELSGADRLCIKIYDERNGKMKTVSALNCGWYENHSASTVNIREGVGAKIDILRKVINDGISRVVDNYDKIRETLKVVPDWELFKDVKSCALVPIKIDNKVFGIIFLDSYKDNFFTEDDLLVLEAFSSQAAIALRNAMLFDKLQKVTETFPGISELDTDIDKVLQNIANIAAEVLETDILLFYRWDEEHKKIIWPPIYKGDIKYPEYMLSEEISSDTPMKIIKGGTSHYAEYSQEDDIMTSQRKSPLGDAPGRFVFREGIISSAGIVLKVGQEIVGVMFINYRTHHKFDEDERKIIENYVSYIAIAIQNVRHFSEKQAADAMQTLGQLAAAIAHKIKNDIGTINLYTGDLMDDLSQKDPSYFSLSQIKEKVRKISSDINNLLIASKRKIPEKKFVDIKALIYEIEQEIVSDLKAKNIELQKKISAKVPEIEVDPAQIKMVLSNLAYNSIEAMPKGGKISISISELEHVVLLDWKDTGNGISPENAEKVFQPFWTTKNKGFGLGLFLSKTIIEEHEGSISLDLRYKKGAKFTIKFPIKEQD